MQHPGLPLTTSEIAREAELCREAGASMMHLHVRDADGRPSLDPVLYRSALMAIRERVGEQLLVQVSSEAADRFGADEQRHAMRELKPAAFSVALREMLPEGADERPAAVFYEEAARAGWLVQHILYLPSEAQRLLELVARGVVPVEPASVLFVLGSYSGEEAAPGDLLPFLDVWRDRGPWMVCAFGGRGLSCLATAAEHGGHVRVGFENNLHLSGGELAPSNSALVAEVSRELRSSGLVAADGEEARRVLAGRIG